MGGHWKTTCSSFTGVGTVGFQALENKVIKFWHLEERYQPSNPLTEAELNCEKFYDDTTTRDKRTGKLIVKLQFVKEPAVLGSSEEMAIRRFFYLERKFERDPHLKSEYVNIMKEYE